MSWSIFVSNIELIDMDYTQTGDDERQHMLATLFQILKEKTAADTKEVLALAVLIKQIKESIQNGDANFVSMNDFELMLTEIQNASIVLPSINEPKTVTSKLLKAIITYQEEETLAHRKSTASIEQNTQLYNELTGDYYHLGVAILIMGVAILGVALLLPLTPSLLVGFITAGLTLIVEAGFLTYGSSWLSGFLTSYQKNIENAESTSLQDFGGAEQEYQASIETICDGITFAEPEAEKVRKSQTVPSLRAKSSLVTHSLFTDISHEKEQTVSTPFAFTR